ncbi:alkylation response protein AidB-like acyl-CoA dehydrogenase [Kineococcus radiotolerans]|uniref:Dibenzothiophene monooxygenase n=1 Tax=Kineococcus radiotolerans TaxID=131568 RepID=A0A7W4XX54_KINRA|nr:acyl-CoA dehydrogenase family protein [Kineococcus radiotolerans]MBB2901771.1 alkylation response protein AidB-like acyl-CoA dehydrogenase [Kineococcus radiotolerans]
MTTTEIETTAGTATNAGTATTAEQVLDAARGVADRLALDALERDRANAEPSAEAELLRGAGLPGVLLPREVGGGGLPWSVGLDVVREIARADGSIAQLLAYHYVNAHNLVWVADEAGRRRWGVPSAARQWLWGDSVNPVDPDLQLVRDGEGYLLRGTKSFSTGASVGDVTVVGGVADDTGKDLLVVVPRDAPGFVKGGDWDNLGQRLSASGSVRFDDVRITPDAVLGSASESGAFGSLVTPAIQAAFGHFYLGVTRGALETAAEYTRTTSRPWLLSDVREAVEDPYVLATYGRLVARLRAAEALGRSVGESLSQAHERGPDLTWAERGEVAEEIAALKVVSSDLAVEATSAIYEVTGARATSNRYGFDRFWRNVRTHTLHDPVQYKAREVGHHFLTGAHPGFTLYT